MLQEYRHAGLVHRAATGARRAAGPLAVRCEFAATTRPPGRGRSGPPGNSGLAHVHPQRQRRPHRGLSNLVDHSGTSVTKTIYRHEIGPALNKGANGQLG
jgi:hypothetical protein